MWELSDLRARGCFWNAPAAPFAIEGSPLYNTVYFLQITPGAPNINMNSLKSQRG